MGDAGTQKMRLRDFLRETTSSVTAAPCHRLACGLGPGSALKAHRAFIHCRTALRAPEGKYLWRQIAAATARRDRLLLAELCSCTRCPVAADCRRYGEAGPRVPCGIMLLYAMPHGDRLPPLRRGGIACSLRSYDIVRNVLWRRGRRRCGVFQCCTITRRPFGPPRCCRFRFLFCQNPPVSRPSLPVPDREPHELRRFFGGFGPVGMRDQHFHAFERGFWGLF